jgi:uncharacterized protein YdbL (DUF1318 family)
MVQITNGHQTLEVTRGAFEETYAPLGYTEVNGGQANGQQATNNGSLGETFTGFTGDPSQDAQDQSELNQANAQASDASLPKRKSKSE